MAKVITATGVQLPEIINLAITKAGLNYGEAYPTVIAPVGTGEYSIRLANGDTIKATKVTYGYPRIVSIV